MSFIYNHAELAYLLLNIAFFIFALKYRFKYKIDDGDFSTDVIDDKVANILIISLKIWLLITGYIVSGLVAIIYLISFKLINITKLTVLNKTMTSMFMTITLITGFFPVIVIMSLISIFFTFTPEALRLKRKNN